jgi:hypothetical protein
MMPQIEKLARLAGARFVINEISHNESVRAGSSLGIEMKWINTGAGKVYKPYVLRFFFLDPENKVVFITDSNAEPVSWLPGEFQIKESFQIPVYVRKGLYKLAVALVNKNSNQPSFRLAIEVPEINRMYILSSIKVN